MQKQSYDQFLQIHIPAEKRDNSGLQEVFKSVFPIEDFAGKSHLEFVKYEFEAPKYDVEECGQRGITFAIIRIKQVCNNRAACAIVNMNTAHRLEGKYPISSKRGEFTPAPVTV